MDAVKAQFETNLFGVIRCQKAVLPYMREQKSGKIINISSVGGIWGQPFNDVYCASKFALEGMVESQAPVFKTFGVYCSCVEPGAIKSAFWSNAQVPEFASMPAEYQKPLQSTMAAYGALAKEVADIIIEKIVQVGEPPVRLQTNPAIQKVFEQQLGQNLSGSAGLQMSTTRFLSDLNLHHAARNDEVLVAKGILSKSRKSLHNKDKLGQHTPLHTAAYEGGVSVAQLLVDSKAPFERRRKNEWSVCRSLWAAPDTRGAWEKTALHLAARRGQAEAVQLLLGQGAQLSMADKD
eukprot:g1300.t1